MCAEDTPVGQWKYTDGQSWHRDSSLKITCVERELPECVYNDQTDFEGGDLPEALGGGGLVTSATSSAECISECETRKACRYWTWTGEPGANCYLKTDRLSQVQFLDQMFIWKRQKRNVKQIVKSSGSSTKACVGFCVVRLCCSAKASGESGTEVQ